MLRRLRSLALSDDRSHGGWLAGAAAGAIALCCALPLIVAGGLGAAAAGVLFGPIGLAVMAAAVFAAVWWKVRHLRPTRYERTSGSRSTDG